MIRPPMSVHQAVICTCPSGPAWMAWYERHAVSLAAIAAAIRRTLTGFASSCPHTLCFDYHIWQFVWLIPLRMHTKQVPCFA